MSLPVLILAGGLGARLRPLTQNLPKALVEINGEPFLSHQLKLLRSRGIDRVILSVGYLGEMIREYVGNGSAFGLEIEYSFDGPAPLGTAGAIRRALPLLGETFFTLYGDSYLPCNYGAVAHALSVSDGAALMTVYRNDGRWEASNVEFDGRRIIAYDKENRTPRMRHIDYGLGVFRPTVFEALPADGAYDLSAVYQELLRSGRLMGWDVPQRFYEIGSFQGIEELSAYLKSGADEST